MIDPRFIDGLRVDREHFLAEVERSRRAVEFGRAEADRGLQRILDGD